ncbi:hypothetical protein SHIRM173S_02015 [Streptomyces hirsutus]
MFSISASTSTTRPGTPVCSISMPSDSSAAAVMVRISEPTGETVSLPPVIGSSTPSGANSASPLATRRAPVAQPSAKSARMP